MVVNKAKVSLATSKATECVVYVVLYSSSSNSLVLMHGYSFTGKKLEFPEALKGVNILGKKRLARSAFKCPLALTSWL